jgi:hypothetical protein
VCTIGNPISGKLSSFYPVLTSGHVFLVVAFIDKILQGVNTVLGKGCVGGGALDKQYKAIKASPAIFSILHSGPYGSYHVRKPVNNISICNEYVNL